MAETKKGQASKEWEQTIVAAQPAPEPLPEPVIEPVPEPPAPVEAPAEPTPEPIPLEPSGEPIAEPSAPAWEPEAPEAETPGIRVPAAWQPYVKSEGSSLILKQPFLAAVTKADLERAFQQRGVRFRERRWVPYKPDQERDVGPAVDAYQWTPKYEPRAASWLIRQAAARRRAMQGLERVPANLVSKRVVFETEGGFVVEVVYRELGQEKTKYFTIPAAGDHNKVLRLVKSGSYQVATVITPDLVNLLARTSPTGHRATPAGKIRSWPIRNQYPVSVLGIPAHRVRRLTKLGIRTTDQLRMHPTSVVARQLGVASSKVQEWQRASQLLLVKGLDPAYARMFARVGVGLDELRRHTPESLLELVNLTVRGTRGARPAAITAAQAAAWIRAAKKLRRTPQRFPK